MDFKAVFRLMMFLAAYIQSGLTQNPSVSGPYIVVAPKIILPSANYTILVSRNPFQSENEVCQVSVELQCRREATQSARVYTKLLGDFTLKSTDSQKATHVIPQVLSSENYHSCDLVLKNKENGIEFERRELTLSSLPSIAADSKILMQLDKPAYKPLDTVRLRLIVLDKFNLPDLNPENIMVTFHDPNGFTMKKWPKNKNNITMDQNGLMSLELPLADELVYGTWKIEVSANGKTVTKNFVIDRYVMPKFDLKFFVQPKPYITKETTTLSVDVHATYTYKKALNGRLTLSLLNPASPKTNTTKVVDLTSGKAAFTFNPVKELGTNLVTEGTQLELHANVSEARTGRFQTAVHVIPVFANDQFKITWLNPISFFKPGIPITLKLAVSDFENMPVVDQNPDAIKLTSKIASSSAAFQRTTLSIPVSGIVTFHLTQPPTGQEFQFIKVQYKHIILDIPPPRRVVSSDPSTINYLNPVIETQPDELRRGSSVQVNILSTKPLTDPKVNYILWSGKDVVAFRTGLTLHDGGINVDLPTEVRYSQLKLIVYAHVKTGETSSKIISGVVRIPTQNYMKMTLGATQVEPGTNQTIKFETHPGSTIAIRGVDQSLLQLSQDKFVNDISPIDVPYNQFYHAYSEHSSATPGDIYHSDFERNDLLLLTNSNVTQRRTTRQAAFTAPNNYRPIVSDYNYHGGTIRTRSHFPETWLWNQLLAKDFVTDFSEDVPVVPDTITSWFVTALSLNVNSGLAVTETPSKLTVFRPFFITLNLPYSVMQGEQFELQVLIHNYLDDLIQVKVTFHNDKNNIRFMDTRERDMDNVVRTVMVEKAYVGHVSFVIMPLVSGLIPLSIKAVTATAGDAIVRPLRVEVPGARKFNSVNRRLYDGKTETHSEKYTIQRHRTRRDTRHKLTLSEGPMSDSSIMLAEKHNVSGLILFPRGCGEQGMFSFVRNIMALDWQAVNQIRNTEMESKAKQNLEVGYQHQMQYYQPDGSFRYWIDKVYKKATADATWLTAYVLRCLAGAEKYITVDHNVLINGIKFLVGQQDINTGQFVGTASPVGGYWALRGLRNTQSINYALTAYVTLSIIEVTSAISSKISRTDKIRFDNAKVMGLRYISSETSLMDSDLYDLILVTTTLAAANHNSSKLFFDKMNAAAKTKDNGNLKWWEMSPEAKPSSLTIEMTAYALLANLWMNRDTAADSLPIVRWLLAQKQENGAFQTTQDSVVAFAALSKYGEITRSGDSDGVVSIDVLNKDELLGNIVLNRTNRAVPMEFLLPPDLEDDEFTVFVKGKGKAFIEYTEVHYTQRIHNTTNFYDITGEWEEIDDPEKEDMSRLKFCVQLRNNSYNATQQVYAEIKLPTGFNFEEDVLGILPKIRNKPGNTVRLIELKETNTRAIIYYKHLNVPKQCMDLPVHRYHRSTNRYVGTIRVTDYYNPKFNDIATIYPDRTMTVCEICLSTNACDVISGCVASNNAGK